MTITEQMVEIGNRLVHLADVEIIEGLLDAGYLVDITADRRITITPAFNDDVREHLQACANDVEAIVTAYTVKHFVRGVCDYVATRLSS